MPQMSAGNQAEVQAWLNNELEKARKNSTLMSGTAYAALAVLQAATTISTT